MDIDLYECMKRNLRKKIFNFVNKDASNWMRTGDKFNLEIRNAFLKISLKAILH